MHRTSQFKYFITNVLLNVIAISFNIHPIYSTGVADNIFTLKDMKANCAINIFGFRAGTCGIQYSRSIGTTTYKDIQYSGDNSEDVNPYSLSRASKIQIGSLTKSFTCTLLTILSNRRSKKDLSTTIISPQMTILDIFSLPNSLIPISVVSKSDFKDVTLKQLCEMRSGITDENVSGKYGALLYWNPGCPSASTKMQCNPDLCPDLSTGPEELQKEGVCKNSVQMRRLALVEMALKTKDEYKCGAGTGGSTKPCYKYSNVGITIVGAALEVVTGKTWEQLTIDNIFNPLGMLSGGFGSPEGKCSPYGHINFIRFPQTKGLFFNSPVIAPAGAIHATMEDLSKYYIWWLRGVVGQSRRTNLGLKDEDFLKQMTSQYKNIQGIKYSGGWIQNDKNQDIYTHNGMNSFYSIVTMDVKREIVVFSNSNQNELDTPLSRNHFHSYVNHIAQKLMDLKDSLLHCMPASTYYNDTTHFPTDCVVENSKEVATSLVECKACIRLKPIVYVILAGFCILVAACCVCCCRFGVKCCGVPLSQIFGGWNNLGKKSSNYSKLTGKEDTSGGGERYVPPQVEVTNTK